MRSLITSILFASAVWVVLGHNHVEPTAFDPDNPPWTRVPLQKHNEPIQGPVRFKYKYYLC